MYLSLSIRFEKGIIVGSIKIEIINRIEFKHKENNTGNALNFMTFLFNERLIKY